MWRLGFLLFYIVVAVNGRTDPNDVRALNDLFSNLKSSSQLTNWSPSGGDPCGQQSWRGVTCSESAVTELDLSRFGLSGGMGYSLDKLTSLTLLDLSYNNLDSEIPYQLPPKLLRLDLSHNALTGGIPYSIPNMPSLQYLSVSNNQLTTINDIFWNMKSLTTLDLSFNGFSGNLPQSLKSLSSLNTLYLQNNQFTGTINVLADLRLDNLNVANNHFSGWIPEKLQKIRNCEFGGNSWNSGPAPPSFTPMTSSTESNGGRKKSGIGGGGIAGIILSLLIVGALLAFFLIRKKSRNNPNDEKLEQEQCFTPLASIEHNEMKSVPKYSDVDAITLEVQNPSPVNHKSPTPPTLKPPPFDRYTSYVDGDSAYTPATKKSDRAPISATIYSVADLQLATGSFSVDNLLGEGSIGRVYKARFDNGKILAVKKIKSLGYSNQATEEFLDVVSNISRLHHPNVTELVGYCCEHGQHLLAYEFLKNGSLHDFLHLSDEYSRPLTWNTRVKIALGTARALEYLHEACSPSIVHKNFKSSNILLDGELNPHLSDCGLSKLSSDLDYQMETPPTNVASGGDSSFYVPPGSTDPAWQFGYLSNRADSNTVTCRLCKKVVKGGIYRFKQHLAHRKGNVAACPKVDEETKKMMISYLDDVARKKSQKAIEVSEMRDEIDIGIAGDAGSAKRHRSSESLEQNVAVQGTRQMSIKDALSKDHRERVVSYICNWAYTSAIPFNAFTTKQFKQMVEAIGMYGPGLKTPTRYEISGPFLKKAVKKISDDLQCHRITWKKTGCSIMTDAWTDMRGRSIMNFCVNCSLGTSFLKSIDASDETHTADYIFQLVDECINEVGVDSVVQVVADNASANVAAGRLLLTKYPQIWWTSCAAHSIDLALEEISRDSKVKSAVKKARTLTIFIYAHTKTLSLMRKFTNKRDIARPGQTRFATTFLTLESILEKKDKLRLMFSSDEWRACKWYKTKKGEQAASIVFSPTFWNHTAFAIKIFTPLVRLLRVVDADCRPSMGFVYGGLEEAKREIIASLNSVESSYKFFVDAIISKTKGRLDTPLHLAAYFLNPYFFFTECGGDVDIVVKRGFMACMERFYPDLDIQDAITTKELLDYRHGRGAFGKPLAVRQRMRNDENFDPANWWYNYGDDVPHLKDMAIKILSLTSASSGCERNWSTFDSRMDQYLSSGYGSPEVAMGSPYTLKSDVFSFGVVMLELLTGRKPHDSSRPRLEQSLVHWATPQLHDIDALDKMVDPALKGIFPAKSLSRFADVIALCVQTEPEFRPPMSEVVQALVRLVQRANMSKRMGSMDEKDASRRNSDVDMHDMF